MYGFRLPGEKHLPGTGDRLAVMRGQSYSLDAWGGHGVCDARPSIRSISQQSRRFAPTGERKSEWSRFLSRFAASLQEWRSRGWRGRQR